MGQQLLLDHDPPGVLRSQTLDVAHNRRSKGFVMWLHEPVCLHTYMWAPLTLITAHYEGR